MNFKDFLNKAKEQLNNKKTGNLLIIFLFAVLLFIFSEYIPSGDKANSSKDVSSQNSISQNVVNTNIDDEYEVSLKNELEETLSKIRGVGIVDVMIYFESGSEKIPVFNK